MDTNAKISPEGFLLAAVGVAIGTIVGDHFGPKIRANVSARIKARRDLKNQKTSSHEAAEGSPLDIITKKYMR